MTAFTAKRTAKRAAKITAAATLPMLVALCAVPALAQTVEGNGSAKVMMFDRPPSVEELRGVVAPEPKIRTRSIEIIGGAAASAARRPRPTDRVNYAPPPAPPAGAAAEAAGTAPPAMPQATEEPAPQQAALSTAPPASETASETTPNATPNAFGFRINFALNSAVIPADATAYIDAVGGLMEQDPSVRLTVEGHTDATGTMAYNIALSQRRAVSVGEYLVRVHHIDPRRITVDGKGPTAPLVSDPYDGRNRRVEFRPGS